MGALTPRATDCKLPPMIDQDLPISPDQLVAGARASADSCGSDLRGLLATANNEYRAILAELDRLFNSGVERRMESTASRVENLHRSKQLQLSAQEFDGAINRLSDAARCIAEASEILEGKIVRLNRSQEQTETSLETVAIQAQEEERYRLAREIHDGPAQILANVGLQLEYIAKLSTRDPARARDEMENIQTDLRLAIGEVRRFMYDLRPPALAQQGVGAAVESHCQRLAHRFGIEIVVNWRSSSVLPPSHDTAVFRIVQEALQNIVKHAQATMVEVKSADTENALEVTVSDNGKGFETNHIRRLDPKHFGLSGMRARAQQIGATLDVSSTAGHGTTVRISVPLS